MTAAVYLQPLWVRYALSWILLSNGADLVLTLWGVQMARIAEGNPVMAALLSVSPAGAILTKFSAVLLGVLALFWAYPRRPVFTGSAILFLCAVMAVVIGMHAIWIAGLAMG